MKKVFLVIFTIVLFSSCELGKTPVKLSDQRFNGRFEHDMNSVMYGNGYHAYIFNGTNKADLISFQYYSSGSKHNSFEMEIEVKNNQFREQLWDNPYSNWSEWEDYHFDDEGDLWFGLLEYKKD